MAEYELAAERIDPMAALRRCERRKLSSAPDRHRGARRCDHPAEFSPPQSRPAISNRIEGAILLLKFDLRGVEVKHGVRQDSPPKVASVIRKLIVDTDEADRRLELLHTGIQKFGTISNTASVAAGIEGPLRRMV